MMMMMMMMMMIIIIIFLTCYCSNFGCGGMNEGLNKNLHNKVFLEEKIFPPFLPETEPSTFRSRVRRSTNEPYFCPMYHN